MSFNITDFKTRLRGGGARPSLFEVTLGFPDDIEGASEIFRFMCKASSIPTSTVAPIEVPYFGRKVKFAGNRTFPEWTVTIINDENFKVRRGFERWMARINSHETNVRTLTERINLSGYQATGTVRQFGKTGGQAVLAEYTFANVFPSEISPIELNWSSENEIEEFTVTLQYDYWKGGGESDGIIGGGGGLISV